METCRNPFQGPDGYINYCADDRIQAVRSFDLEQCRDALALPLLQKTVAQAVERRIRKLEKAQAGRAK